jgi:hypothetical protein
MLTRAPITFKTFDIVEDFRGKNILKTKSPQIFRWNLKQLENPVASGALFPP